MSVAVVVGAGPGLGAALCRRFAAGGMRLAAARRDGEAAREVAETAGGRGYACDATDRTAVAELFRAVDRDLGTPELVVFNAGAFRPAGVLDIDPEEFERCWRIGCLGALHVGQEALRRMAERGRGTLILTGATAALRGGKGFANLAVPKFGLRALAQSMAREMHPQGVHVAHTIIDGQIRNDARGGRHAASERGEDALLEPDTIAEAYWQLHLQPKSAWTQELDLRPWVETF